MKELSAMTGLEAKPDLSKETTLDRIFAWYMEGEDAVQLSQKEILQKDRYKFAFACMLDGKMDHQIVETTAAFFGVSQRQAYRDVADSKKLYADINKTDKEADRYLITQYLMQAFQLAKAKGDTKYMIKASEAIGKIKGLDKNDPDLPDPDAFKPHTYIIQIASSSGAENGEKKTINLDAIAKLPPAEFEEVMEQIQQSDISDLEMIKLLNEAARAKD